MLNSVTNFQTPPAFLTEIAEVITPLGNGVDYSYDQNSANPLYTGFIAQSVIVDGRAMASGDSAIISFNNGRFNITVTNNVYRSYIIPGYLPTQFAANFNSGASTSSQCVLRLYNFQMLPCNYLKTGV